MPQSTRNSGKPWRKSDITLLRRLAEDNTPTSEIGVKLGRTLVAINTKAAEEGLILTPTSRFRRGHRFRARR
jgi:hypothetical protein